MKELEENFSDSRACLLKQMEENSKYIAELKGTIYENEIKLSNYIDENKCLKVLLDRKCMLIYKWATGFVTESTLRTI